MTIAIIVSGATGWALGMYKSLDETNEIAKRHREEAADIPMINHTIAVDKVLNDKQDVINETLAAPIAGIHPTIKEIVAEKDVAKRQVLEAQRRANVKTFLYDPANEKIATAAKAYFFAADDTSACLKGQKCDEATFRKLENPGFCAMQRTYDDFVRDQRSQRDDFAENFVWAMSNVDCQKVLYH